MSLLCRPHSLQSAIGLLCRTQAALSVFSCSGFSGWSAPRLHGGIVTFLIIYMGDHYSLRGETLVFLVIYMGELSWTVLGRSWVGLARPLAETSANHHVNGSKHLHGGMLWGVFEALKGFYKRL